jgi:hypothetical protein
MKSIFALFKDYFNYVFTWDFFYIGFFVILAISIIGCKWTCGVVKVKDLAAGSLIACINQLFAVIFGAAVIFMCLGFAFGAVVITGALIYKYILVKPWKKIKDKKIF